MQSTLVLAYNKYVLYPVYVKDIAYWNQIVSRILFPIVKLEFLNPIQATKDYAPATAGKDFCAGFGEIAF